MYGCQEYFEKNVENDLNKYHADAKMLDSVSNVMIWFSYTVKCKNGEKNGKVFQNKSHIR